MEKHLHQAIHQNQPLNSGIDTELALQQARMEEEFAHELALLKSLKLEPRKEAVEKLIAMIVQQNVAEHH